MPILDRDPATDPWGDPDPMFSVRCDCAGQGAACVQLDFTSFSDGPILPLDFCVGVSPADYPWGFRQRVRIALEVLLHGRLRYRDELVLERPTVIALAARLGEVAERMVGR